MSTYEIKNYDELRPNLRVRLMDTKAHADVLQKTVHVPVGCGLALVAYFKVPEEIAGCEGIANVPKEMAAIGDIDEGKVIGDAMIGSVAYDMPKLCSMRDAIFGNKDENYLDGGNASEDMLYVLTTEHGLLGASTLFYPGIKEKIAAAVGSDYYVLPSSVHEVLILPDKGQMEPKELLHMVKSINETEVAPQDRLCDRVFKYRIDTKELTVAADVERRRDMER